jgi:hypothetical protein
VLHANLVVRFTAADFSKAAIGRMLRSGCDIDRIVSV